MALTLSAWDKIEYRSAAKQGDAESQLSPTGGSLRCGALPGDAILMLETLADTDSPATAVIRTATDRMLAKVQDIALKVWP